MTNSRQKGARVERLLASAIRAYGWDARRGQQYCGSPDSPDVVSDMPITWESKGREKWSLYDWMAKLKRELAPGTLPVIAAKKNHCEFLAVIPLADFLTFCQFTDLEAYEKYKRLEDLQL